MQHLHRAVVLALAAALAWPVIGGAGARADEPLELEPEFVVDPAVLQQLLRDGHALADDGQVIEAALRFHDIVRNGAEGSPEVLQAQYELGVALHELRLPQSALSFFEAVVDAGPEGPRYPQTLTYLLQISRETGGDTNVLGLIAGYPPELYPPDFADELHFLVGQYLYGESQLSEALERFAQVTNATGEFFVRARYLEAIVNVQQSRLGEDPTKTRAERLQQAAESFKAVLRHQRDYCGGDVVDRVAGMAQLALGRLFFSTRQYDVAVRYYSQTSEDSDEWLPALFEVSWVHFQLKNYPKALGNLHTLNSPYFADQYFPESRVLQALILFYGCRYDEADAVVKEFVQDYYPLMTELKDEINKVADPNAFYRWLARLSKMGNTEFSERFKRIFNAALADRKLRRKFNFVAELNRELGRVEALEIEHRAAGTLLDELKGELVGYRSLVIGEAGSLAQARLLRLLKELKQHLAAALRIKGETLKARRGVLAPSIRAEQAAAAASKIDIVVDAEHIEWPFTGEYWKDELGSYLYDIPSRCGQTPAP